MELEDSYKSLIEALKHGGVANNVSIDIRWIESANLKTEERWQDRLQDLDAILVPGGFGKRGISGMLRAIHYARDHKVPFFGICLGMQCACIEYSRNVCHLEGADSTEFDPETNHRIIYKLRDLIGVEAMGGTMRLGAYPCVIKDGTLAQRVYSGANEISERHRHRYEFNPQYEEALVDAGFVISGKSPDGKFVEIIELPDHPWFLGCQFHPESKSKPLDPHPLFSSFIHAAHEHRLRDEDTKKDEEVLAPSNAFSHKLSVSGDD